MRKKHDHRGHDSDDYDRSDFNADRAVSDKNEVITMTKTALAGINIYSVIGLLIAGAIFFHVTKVEESMTMMIAAVVIIYIMMG